MSCQIFQVDLIYEEREIFPVWESNKNNVALVCVLVGIPLYANYADLLFFVCFFAIGFTTF